MSKLDGVVDGRKTTMAEQNDESAKQISPAFLNQIESRKKLGLYEQNDYAGHDGMRRPASSWHGLPQEGKD